VDTERHQTFETGVGIDICKRSKNRPKPDNNGGPKNWHNSHQSIVETWRFAYWYTVGKISFLIRVKMQTAQESNLRLLPKA